MNARATATTQEECNEWLLEPTGWPGHEGHLVRWATILRPRGAVLVIVTCTCDVQCYETPEGPRRRGGGEP